IRVEFIHAAAARLIDVGDVIQVNALRSGVFHGEERVPGQLALYRQAPELGIGRGDVGIHDAAGGARQLLGTGAGERPGVFSADGDRGAQIGRGYAKHEVIRRVLDDVEGHVAEVTLVAESVAAADAGLAGAKRIPGKAHARSEAATRIPQLFVR